MNDLLLTDEEIRTIDISKYFNLKNNTLNFLTYGNAIAQAQLSKILAAGYKSPERERIIKEAVQ